MSYNVKILVMVTPNDTLEVKTLFNKHKGFYCFTQIDGVRIFTKANCSFFQRVSNQLVAALNIGTIQPSSALLDAYRSFRHHQPTADDDITKIEGDLHKAVIELIQAAGQVFNRDIRNFLVKASGFGKKFVSHFQEFEAQKYIKYMKRIRVLYDIREFTKIPIMITASQFEKIKPKGLIKKMLKYNQHYRAAEISKFLGLKEQKVAQDWACKVIKHSLEEEQFDVQKRVLKKLSKFNGINYIKITEFAEQVGRKGIAYQLIQREKSYIQKVFNLTVE